MLPPIHLHSMIKQKTSHGTTGPMNFAKGLAASGGFEHLDP